MKLNEVRTILLVDDDFTVTQMLTNFIVGKELNVFSANSGEEAIKILNNFQIDLIISDYEMLNGDGVWLLKHISQIESRPLFYFFSGRGDELKKLKNELSFEDAYMKPFDLESVFQLLNSINAST